ncbi:MAG: 16S rRNA (guanine(527)-N(7))-methyltransferase RsmG [Actinomycetota bacterium]
MRKSDTPDLTGLAARIAGSPLPPEANDKLAAFEDLLRDRGPALGLVSRDDASRIRERHVLDSLRGVRAVEPDDAVAYDLGSGAGLPGLVVAIARPALDIRLVEIRRRRAAWLELAIHELEVANASVVVARVEELRDSADLCFARAFAPLARSWGLAAPLLTPRGRLVYFAGGNQPEDELAAFGSNARIIREPLLDSSGPLVIIGKQ